MIVLNKVIIDNCVFKHAGAKKAMNAFVSMLKAVECKNHGDILAQFPKADYVGNNRYVFDIKGNDYRIVCIIVFVSGTAAVRFAGTHAEYDKINAATI